MCLNLHSEVTEEFDLGGDQTSILGTGMEEGDYTFYF